MQLDLEQWNARGAGRLPGLLGVRIDEIDVGTVRAHLDVRGELLAPNGYLHAGTVVTLADTCCGYGCLASLPAEAGGFTTVELKANFLGTALEGRLRCAATMAHGGRTTQVWDATVTADGGRTVALFRCTQLVLSRRR